LRGGVHGGAIGNEGVRVSAGKRGERIWDWQEIDKGELRGRERGGAISTWTATEEKEGGEEEKHHGGLGDDDGEGEGGGGGQEMVREDGG